LIDYRIISSDGQSKSLIMTRSQVQVLNDPQKKEFFEEMKIKKRDEDNTGAIVTIPNTKM
jgi:hypothetical protein